VGGLRRSTDFYHDHGLSDLARSLICGFAGCGGWKWPLAGCPYGDTSARTGHLLDRLAHGHRCWGSIDGFDV
jgi:hypothetical protein